MKLGAVRSGEVNDTIRAMRSQGKTMREIAAAVGISAVAVCKRAQRMGGV